MLSPGNESLMEGAIMNFRSKELNFEDQTFNRYNQEFEEMKKERRKRRHPNDFEDWPSNEQMEAFKRGDR